MIVSQKYVLKKGKYPMFKKKNTRIITIIICVVLVLAMVIPMVVTGILYAK